MKKILAILILLFASISASAITVYAYNLSRDYPIVDSEIDKVRPIASITKLMTAIVVAESGVDLDEKVPYQGNIFSRRRFTREELLHLLLVKSDNKAAEALAESMGGKLWTVFHMNKRAIALGMYDTNFDDTSGLSGKNTSTAKDLVVLLTYAYQNDMIRKISALSGYNLSVLDKKNKERFVQVNNTNRNLLTKFDVIEMSKTGTTSLAGKCVVLMVTKNEEKYAIVVLGGKTRSDVDNLVKNIITKLL